MKSLLFHKRSIRSEQQEMMDLPPVIGSTENLLFETYKRAAKEPFE